MLLRLLSPRYWPTWLGLAILRALVLLPYPWLMRIGRAFGRLVRLLPLSYVSTARTNLELCLPELDAAARETLVRRHFESLGMGLCEIGLAWWASDERIRQLLQIEGAEHLTNAFARGRGLILLGSHFTSLEMSGRAIAIAAPLNIVYRPTRNAVLAHFLQRRRAQRSRGAIPNTDARGMLAALKRNEALWYAPDQSYRKKGAMLVPFFGVPAATNTATSRLAKLSHAAVIPYFFERLPDDRGYRGVIHPPLENFPGESPLDDALRFHHLIESHARRVPEQYFWIHRRFKGLDESYPDYYARHRARA